MLGIREVGQLGIGQFDIGQFGHGHAVRLQLPPRQRGGEGPTGLGIEQSRRPDHKPDVGPSCQRLGRRTHALDQHESFARPTLARLEPLDELSSILAQHPSHSAFAFRSIWTPWITHLP